MLPHLVANAISHFPRGPVGEGDGHHAAQGFGTGNTLQFGQKPLCQHERLAATGPCRQSYGNVAGFNRLLLLRCIGHFETVLGGKGLKK
ncbi:MAG: hypothetical protein R3C12_10310 [Planctomycetaceae bacterium]